MPLLRTALAIALLLSASTARAQSIHKCVDKRGAIAYQSAACAATSHTDWIREAPADTMGAERRRALAARRRKEDADSRYLSQLAGTSRPAPGHHRPPTDHQPRRRPSSTRHSSDDGLRCTLARQHRENVLRQVGLARNFNLLRQLDDQVRAACR